MSSRSARRMMQRMGMEVEEIRNATQVTIKTPSREIVIDDPEVSVTKMQDQKIFQIMGGVVTERKIVKEMILEEDVKLVAQQANVSIDLARNALESTKGDLAQAIFQAHIFSLKNINCRLQETI
jgi:nascent polypeptide-associated complex subunit alpha